METEMNEQIREFAEQSRKKPMGDSWCYTTPREFEQKFADLIVKECVEICERGTVTQTTSGGAAMMIKKHFGVAQ